MKNCVDIIKKKSIIESVIPLAAATGFFPVLYGIYRYGFYSPHKGQDDEHRLVIPLKTQAQRDHTNELIDSLNARPFEQVYTYSSDGLRLSGKYFHVRDEAPLAILFHGYRGTPIRDFCGGANLCFSMGLNVLLVHERAHGSSEGHTITFGVKERFDVLSWVDYAVKRFGNDVKIILGGISMGAGTVLMASELDLPENVKGILADCPFTSPEEIIMDFGKSKGFPMKIAYPLTFLSARLFGGFSLSATDAVKAVKKTKAPILIIHGEDDTLVSPEMSRRIAEANPAMIERYTFPGAEHGISYMIDPERYADILSAFCERIFADQKPDGQKYEM